MFLISLPPQQAIESVQLSWAFCENCLSEFCELTCMDALMPWAQEAQERRFHSMITVLLHWVPLFFRGVVVVAACYKTRPCVLPFGPAIKRLFNFAPGKISLVTLLGCSKRVTRLRGESRNA
jgi:hypothetical protein